MLLINAVNAEGRPVELYVKDGKIAAVGQDLAALAGENETVLDAGGLTVLPAFVDLHCHWRTPGFEYKEDIETGSRAAAAGGYTFVNLMPNSQIRSITPSSSLKKTAPSNQHEACAGVRHILCPFPYRSYVSHQTHLQRSPQTRPVSPYQELAGSRSLRFPH